MAEVTLEQFLAADTKLRDGLSAVAQAYRDALRRRSAADRLAASELGPRLAAMLAEGGRRICGIGGLPGAGKSRLAARLAREFDRMPGTPRAVHLPMDGFHRPHAWLEAAGLDHLKGREETFDAGAYAHALGRFLAEPSTPQSAPDYDRARRDVVAGRIDIPADVRLLLTEGVYVGLRRPPWTAVADRLDLSLFLDVDPVLCLRRVVARNVEFGRTPLLISAKLHNDLQIMKAALPIADSAHLILTD